MEFKKVCPEEIDAIVRIEQSGFTPEEAGSKATFIERIKNEVSGAGFGCPNWGWCWKLRLLGRL